MKCINLLDLPASLAAPCSTIIHLRNAGAYRDVPTPQAGNMYCTTQYSTNLYTNLTIFQGGSNDTNRKYTSVTVKTPEVMDSKI